MLLRFSLHWLNTMKGTSYFFQLTNHALWVGIAVVSVRLLVRAIAAFNACTKYFANRG
jgi:hypothetical protein